MDSSLFCTDDSLPSSEPHTDGQTEVLAHELGTETLSKTAENNTINITTEEKLSDCDRSNYSAHSISFCPEASQKPASKGPCCLDLSEPESDALFPVPELCNDFIPILSRTTEFYAGPETSLLPYEHKMRTTEFNNLESVEVSAPLSDLYIFESETQDFIVTHTANPYKITSPEYLPVSHSGGKTVQEWEAQDPMCYLEATEKRCQSGFREERASENNVSDVSQREELRATAVDAWEVHWMSENDVRPEKAEVTALTLQRQHSNSPTELWLDACQYLTGEEAEDKEVLDQQAISNSLQESDYNPSDSRRIGWSPVKRWSSVDSWASARSDWTGVIEDPPEDITAAFAEIGAEIDALTQALREVTTHREPEVLQEDPRATVEEEKQRTMGVQDQPLKTSDIPEGSVSSEQSCLSLCLEASRPKLCKREGPRGLRSLSKFEGELDPEQPSSYSAPQNSPAGSFSVRAESDAELMEVTINAGSVSSGCLDLPQFDRYLKSFDQDLFSSEEDHPIELKITEDVDLNTQREVVFEEGFGDSLFKLPSESAFYQQSSVTEEHFKGNQVKTDCRVFSTDIQKNSNEPGVDSGINVSFNICSDSVGARKVESYSPELIMCLDPVSGDSALVCETNSSLEGDQSCTETCLSDSIDCRHVPDYSTFPTLGGITNEQFLEGHKELIHKTQNIINTAEKVSPDELQEVEPEEPVWPFLSVTADSRDLARFTVFPGDHLFISEKNCVACITLDLNDPFVPWISEPIFTTTESELSQLEMPHKTSKNSSDKTRTKKEKSALNHHGAQAPKKQESTPLHNSNQQTWKQQESSPATGENHIIENNRLEVNEAKVVMENIVGTEKGTGKPHGKKKKKHGHKAAGKQEAEASVDLEHGAKAKTTKGKVDMFETKLGIKGGKAQQDVKQAAKTQQPEDMVPQQAPRLTNDDVVKKRRVSGDKFGKILSVLESKLPKADASLRAKEEETQTQITAAQKKTYSDVVKQKIPPKEDPKVVESIQAVSVSGDPQSLCLWCQFAGVHSDYTVTWSRDTTPLAQVNRSAGDESRVSLIINNATHKDLGKYVCQLNCSHGSVYLDYVLTYEVLSEIVIPASPKFLSSVAEELCSEEEDAHCSRLLFKEDFLSDQYFGENHPISILTEKVHFGEGMHRRAFRTKLKAGQIPLLVPGNSCVLKVHNSISYGTKNNDDILQKNFNLAVEECQVQNTAREYIKAYTSAAQSVEAFGDVPEIIPIYLVHRPSNDIPYATLEEELIGDFVKYSVKDGKEINMMRRDSEAGQKCCAFQHWVYHNTEGNLLVTDMQGVGMKLTDVGIATCKKGYKGFKGNCAFSFIDQFKALHQCNKYCEILGLKPLQPKPKKVPAAPKPKPPPPAVPKKKTFGPTMKNKS